MKGPWKLDFIALSSGHLTFNAFDIKLLSTNPDKQRGFIRRIENALGSAGEQVGNIGSAFGRVDSYDIVIP